MALWVCKRCGTAYAVGLRMCPQCTSEEVWKEDEVPKTTVYGGASYKEGEAPPEEATETAPAVEATAPAGDLDEEQGGYYDGWLKDDLQDELVKRGLAKSGTVAELVARLEEDDAAADTDEAPGTDEGGGG